MNSNFRNFAIWIIIGLLLIALFNLFQSPGRQQADNSISYSQFLSAVENSNVRSVTLSGDKIVGQYSDGRSFETFGPNDPKLVERLESKGVGISVKPQDDSSPTLLSILISWFPMLLLV